MGSFYFFIAHSLATNIVNDDRCTSYFSYSKVLLHVGLGMYMRSWNPTSCSTYQYHIYVVAFPTSCSLDIGWEFYCYPFFLPISCLFGLLTSPHRHTTRHVHESPWPVSTLLPSAVSSGTSPLKITCKNWIPYRIHSSSERIPHRIIALFWLYCGSVSVKSVFGVNGYASLVSFSLRLDICDFLGYY